MEGNPILRRVVYLHEISEMPLEKPQKSLMSRKAQSTRGYSAHGEIYIGFERAAGNSWPKGSANSI